MHENNCCQDFTPNNTTPTIGNLAPSFEAEMFQKETIKKINLEDYRGKWIILFFYPADFTFVCPTELGDLADKYEDFKKLNAEILSISTDTVFTHKAWHDQSETIKKIDFPMVADPTGNIAKSYGVMIEEEGLALRGTFVIDPEGHLKTLEVHDNGIGRNMEELLRKLQSLPGVVRTETQIILSSYKYGVRVPVTDDNK